MGDFMAYDVNERSIPRKERLFDGNCDQTMHRQSLARKKLTRSDKCEACVLPDETDCKCVITVISESLTCHHREN
jgi:hypothetical protein